MTKKRSSEILVDENRKMFWEKVKSGKFSAESEKISEIGGKSEIGERRHCLRGNGRPYLNPVLTYVLPSVEPLGSSSTNLGLMQDSGNQIKNQINIRLIGKIPQLTQTQK